MTCAVSADKTKFAVLRQTSLYGTAATTNNDISASVVLIDCMFDMQCLAKRLLPPYIKKVTKCQKKKDM